MSDSFLVQHGLELNPSQLEAVATVQGPVLVLAGAGSGKTRVLTYRIAHLVYDYRVPLAGILAMTFSNKAAREMHDRVKALLHDDSLSRFPWISTFHSVSARILRRFGDRIGFKADYVIYDEADQRGIMKDVYAELNISDKDLSMDLAFLKIGDWKNKGLSAHETDRFTTTWADEKVQKIYELYQKKLLQAQAMDFDDLLLHFFHLLRDHADVREMLQAQWSYVLVDEFQDTNELQYKILKSLVGPSGNLCVVGDDDQSIYGWRGAKVENILQFDKEYPGAKVIRLEQNYRSTGNILKAAVAVISKNEVRHQKTLWTEASDGPRISLRILPDDRDEARYIIGEIRDAVAQGTKLSEIAVLYRVNALSRGFEEECLRHRVHYQIVGGFRFYERKEIKDLLSYARLLMNPSDLMAFRRSINTPARGLGKVSLDKAEQAAQVLGLAIGDWVVRPDAVMGAGKSKETFSLYKELMTWGRNALEQEISLADLFVEIIRSTKYLEMLEEEGDDDRIANIRELLSAVQDYEEQNRFGSQIKLRERLRSFLEHVTLMADIDSMEADVDKVTFMSLHAAKGLEFKICFIAGMEDGLFPSARSFDSYERSEEERRLCYVGITRAREKLYLTRAERRRVFGSINSCIASRFLKDLPQVILDSVASPDSETSESYSWKRPAQRSQRSEDPWENFEFDQSFENSDFSKGDRVKHPSFGEGIVQKSETMGDDECLSISFAGRGLKKVLAKFVKKAS